MVMELEKSRFFSDNIKPKERKTIASTSVEERCFKTDRTNKKPHSILFEFKDALILKTFDYINLYSKHYDRNMGIILFYTTATVTIYGTHLDGLFTELNERSVTSINESNKMFIADNENETKQAIVTQIDITYKDLDLEKEITRMEETHFKRFDKTA